MLPQTLPSFTGLDPGNPRRDGALSRAVLFGERTERISRLSYELEPDMRLQSEVRPLVATNYLLKPLQVARQVVYVI